MRNSILLILFAIVVTGCSTKIHMYKAYKGKSKTINEIAVLRVPAEIKINTIDGVDGFFPSYVADIAPYDGARVELLPGSHLLNVKYHARGSRSYSSSGNIKLKLKAKAGKKYVIYPHSTYIGSTPNLSKHRIKFNLVECGTKKEMQLRAHRKALTGTYYLPMCEKLSK